MLIVLCLLVAFSTGVVYSSDRVIYDITTQPKCTEVYRKATHDCRWAAGLDMADLIIEQGRIIAYKISWFTGSWSGWYVPGLNDLDLRFNLSGKTKCPLAFKPNSMRRMWSEFYDKEHKYIICKPN